MSHSARPTYDQMLNLMRLMADVAGLKNAPPMQRQILADGLKKIIGTNQVVFAFGDDWLPGKNARFSHLTLCEGIDMGYMKYIAEQFGRESIHADAFCDHSIRDLSGVQSWSFARVLPDREARQRYPLFAEARHATRCTEGMFSVARLNGGKALVVTTHQCGGARAPTPRQRALALLAIEEIKRLVERGHLVLPPSQPAQLPPRLQQVLDHLLSGQHPKQIARELSLSIWTIREHMERLYRHFGVSGREELMSQFIRPPTESLSK